MRRQRLRFEFGMELAADKPGMVGHFNNFHVSAVGRASGDAKARRDQALLVFAIKFVAMPVALGDIASCRKRDMRTNPARCGRATRPAAWCRPFRRRPAIRAACKSRDAAFADRIRCCSRPCRPAHIPRIFDRGALHAQANAEKRNLVFARVLNGVNHALDSALAEAARNQNAVNVRQQPAPRFPANRYLPLRSIR